MNRATAAIIAMIFFLGASHANAQEFTRGARSAGMGEAFVAAASGTNAIAHNPAGLAQKPLYQIDALFEYADTGSILNASVADSKTNPAIGAGASYSYFFGNNTAAEVTGHDIRAILAVPVVPDRISLGIGGRWLILNEGPVELMNGPTIDAGGMFKVMNGLHVGVAGRNLIDQCHQEICNSVAPTVVAGGFAFGGDMGLLLAGEIGVDLTSSDEGVDLEYSGGIEYTAIMVPIRAGFKRTDAIDESLLTFGAGWRSTAAGFDVAYQLDLADTDRMFFLGSFSIFL